MAVDPQHLMALMALMEEEEAEFEGVMMVMARLAAAEIMAVEEGIGLEDLLGESWVPVTVFIDEYHNMPDHVFKLHFRMSKHVFELLAAQVREHLVARGRLRRERRPFRDIMLMIVWLLATPDSFRSVSLRFGVRPSTLYYFYSYVIEALREMAPQYISWPSAADRVVIKEAFRQATGFCGVVGCIDCTHIFITKPVEDGQEYINRHHSHSYNVQAVVDNNLVVTSLHVGEVGSMNDNRVFRRSELYTDILTSAPGVMLTADEHLVGDGAYTLTDFMMVPNPNNGHLNAREQDFNRKLSQCRVRVENGFARAKGLWRRLKFLHVRNRENAIDHITASFVLHNFLIMHGDAMIDEEEIARPIRNNQILGNQVFDNEDAEEHPLAELIAAAEDRGIEKRLMIQNDILPNAAAHLHG